MKSAEQRRTPYEERRIQYVMHVVGATCCIAATGVGDFGRDCVAGETFEGEISPPLGIPKPQHAHPNPTLRSGPSRFANQIATGSNIGSRHLEESAVPDTCPNMYGNKCRLSSLRQTVWTTRVLKDILSGCAEKKMLDVNATFDFPELSVLAMVHASRGDSGVPTLYED